MFKGYREIVEQVTRAGIVLEGTNTEYQRGHVSQEKLKKEEDQYINTLWQALRQLIQILGGRH